MTVEMTVDIAGVRALAGDLVTAAERVAETDPMTPIDASASALPGSDTAAVLAELSPAAGRVVSETALRLRAMSVAAADSATRYAGTDEATAALLAGI